jgi:dipeptidyl-peptidase-4
MTDCFRRGRILLALLVLPLLAGGVAHAQQKRLTLDDLYDPQKRTNFSGTPPSGLAWVDGSHYVWPRAGRDGTEWMKVDATSGQTSALFDAAKMEAALAKISGLSADEARRAARSRDLDFNDTHSAALLTIASDLYAYVPAEDRAVRLTYSPAPKMLASFSPDGRLVAFVRDNNIFVVDVATARERQLTTDGSAKVLNGVLDWVYEEEIYGRGEKRSYWWSPNSSRIAFLQLDDAPVSTYVTLDSIPYDPRIEKWDYPRAGDPNPVARLGVVGSGGGPVTWIDTSKYQPAESLVVRVGWTPDGRQIAYEVQNRTQSWLDLDLWDVESRAARTVFRETSNYWIDSEETTRPTWLKDGSFLWQSDRSGWRHIYHYRGDGTLIRQVSNGTWELRGLHGIDEASGWIYFSSTERSPVGVDTYRIKLDGTGKQRLSSRDGAHQARFSPTFSFFIDVWSDATTPPQTRLHRNDGTEVRVIDANPVAALADFRLSTPEFMQVPTRDGGVMEAMMIKPPDFDSSRRYPVFQYTYGGPRNPQVRNAWGGSQYMYHQLLAQHGIVVWICDNRTASSKGAQSAWPLFHHFGELELRDVQDGLDWLKRQPYIDGSRIGIFGWSYGGFMTSYALTHSTDFVMGIAGGTVSDWRDYDTVYTERYLGLPQENPEGYRASSPRWSAATLHGALLLIHGEIDDNVHIANTMQLAYELEKASQPFQMLIYPKSRHGVTDPALVKHLRQTMLDFTLTHLKPGGGQGPAQ